MKFRHGFFWMILSATLSSSLTYGQTPADKMDELITAYTRSYKFNGTVLVAHDGKIIFEKGYGFKNAKDSTKNDVNTIYQLGSITKQFTATAILKLAEQKKLSTDDRLSKYFPGYPSGDSITIKNLLTHSSGIYNYTEDQPFMKSEAVKPSTKEKMIAMFRDHPLNFSPGSNYSYSNSGYLLLGYIIEQATDKPYEKVIHELIITPLKMNHTGFDFTNLKSPDKAIGYTMLNQVAKIPAGIVDSSVSFAAGAMYSTVEDLLKWHMAFQQNQIISKVSTEAAFTPYKSKYGYGWTIDTLFGKRTVEHGGGIFGFNTYISRVPSDNVVVIILNNMNVGGLENIAHSLLAIIFGRPYEIPKEKSEVPVDSGILAQYVGEYEFGPGFTVKISLVNNKLKVQPTGQSAYDLFAESDHEFFMKIIEAKATFVKGPDGKVEKLLWKQSGTPEQTGKKIK
ncbi:serine hydrolase [Flavitalea sp.]|nr:serine hydrolase [Flavitalea sp.]